MSTNNPFDELARAYSNLLLAAPELSESIAKAQRRLELNKAIHDLIAIPADPADQIKLRKVALELALRHSSRDETAEEAVAVAAIYEKYLTGGLS